MLVKYLEMCVFCCRLKTDVVIRVRSGKLIGIINCALLESAARNERSELEFNIKLKVASLFNGSTNVFSHTDWRLRLSLSRVLPPG